MILLDVNVSLLLSSQQTPSLLYGIFLLLTSLRLQLALVYRHHLNEIFQADWEGMPSLLVKKTSDYHHVIFRRLKACEVDESALKLQLRQMVLSAVIIPEERCLRLEFCRLRWVFSWMHCSLLVSMEIQTIYNLNYQLGIILKWQISMNWKWR